MASPASLVVILPVCLLRFNEVHVWELTLHSLFRRTLLSNSMAVFEILRRIPVSTAVPR
jgi:hypothetical protein